MTKCWQSMQSRGTEKMNLETREWVGMKKTRREDCGHRTKVKNKNSRSHESQPRMERIMHFVAE